MQSRKKWKNRYYKKKKELKEANKAIEQIYEDYQDIGKIAFDLDEREQRLIEKLEEIRNDLEKDGFVGYANEIQDALEIVKGEKK